MIITAYPGDAVRFEDVVGVDFSADDSPPVVRVRTHWVDDDGTPVVAELEGIVVDAEKGALASAGPYAVPEPATLNYRWEVTRWVDFGGDVGVAAMQATYPGDDTYVFVDGTCRWATPAQVATIVGGEYTNPELLAVIDAAQAILSTAFCEPVDCNAVPANVSAATAIVAGRLLTRATPGDPVITSETIGDYTYRVRPAAEGGAVDLIGEVRNLVWPYLCAWARGGGTIVSPRVWPGVPSCPTCGQWALPLLGGCGCDDGLPEYQLDAEGVPRS